MRADKILYLLLSLIFLASCSGGGGGGGGDREESTTGGTATGGTEGGTTGGTTTGGTTGGTTTGGSANYDVTLDSALTSAERSSTLESIEVLEDLRIDGSQIEGFSEVFGGNSTSSVVSYLESRVNYIFSEVTDYRSRLVLASPALINKFAYFGRNESRDIWYTSLINEPNDVRIVINNNEVDIPSSRIGVVNLGDIFAQSDAITRAITLVHEARHSDCPEGAKTSEIQRWFDNLPPIDRTCGQLHGSCTNGGPSCDTFAWGPYAIDFIYSLSIANACSNCTEIQKQQGQANANSVQEAAFDITGTLNGQYGQPDMSNSSQVRDDL